MTTIERFVFAAIALLVAGCQSAHVYGEPLDSKRLEQALENWADHGFVIKTRCEDDMADGMVTLSAWDSQATFPEPCGKTAKRTIGCTLTSEDWDGTVHYSILIRDGLAPDVHEDTLEHELRHWMSKCSLGDADNHHENPSVWYRWKGRDVR